MTRKDYELIAATMLDARPSPYASDAKGYAVRYAARLSQYRIDCETLADALATDNARFDRDKFLAACGV